MSLTNARMSAVLQVAPRVFGRRAEVAIKESPSAGCIADQVTSLGPLTDIVLQLRGERFARNTDNDICLVLEFDVAGSLSGVRLTTSGELWLAIQAAPGIERMSIDISLAYHAFILVSAIPIPPDVSATIDAEIRSQVSPLIESMIVTIPLQSVFADTMCIFGDPEMTLVGGASSPSPTLAIGLEIYDPARGRDGTVDRAHFRQNYNENLLQPAFGHDWGVQIESSLMEVLMQEEFDAFDISRSVPGWKPNDYRKAYWSGNGLDWDYKGWQDYVNAHYTEHPVWLACEGVYDLEVPYPTIDFTEWPPRYVTRYRHIDVGIYWFAYADLRLENETIYLAPHIFELGFRNALSYACPEISADLSPRPVGPARFEEDFLITQPFPSYTTDYFLAYGSDEHEGLAGYPDVQLPPEVVVDFLCIPIELPAGRSLHCTGFRNEGTLEAESVLSQFEICNLGETPLWVCSITMQDDPDSVFVVRLSATTPLRIEAGESVSIDVLMTVPEGDRATHHGSIRVRCNDFDQPSALIPVHGVKQPVASGRAVTCFEIPGLRISEEQLQRILDLVYGNIGERFPELGGIFPPAPEPEPDPPCPTCGYYMEVAIAGLPLDAFIEILDSRGNLVERSQMLNDVHFFSVPLSRSGVFRYRMHPDVVKGKVIVRPGIGRITRVGMFRAGEKILELATDRTLVFTRHTNGIEVVDIADPRAPRRISSVELKGCRGIGKGNGYLYALTDDAVVVFDVSDPYSPNIAHKIPADPDSALLIEGSKIHVWDREKIRVYQMGLRRRLLKEYSTREATTKKAETPSGRFPTIAKEAERLRDRGDFPRGPFVLQDDYLLRIYDDGGAFEILRKDIVPFLLDKKLLEKLK